MRHSLVHPLQVGCEQTEPRQSGDHRFIFDKHNVAGDMLFEPQNVATPDHKSDSKGDAHHHTERDLQGSDLAQHHNKHVQDQIDSAEHYHPPAQDTDSF